MGGMIFLGTSLGHRSIPAPSESSPMNQQQQQQQQPLSGMYYFAQHGHLMNRGRTHSNCSFGSSDTGGKGQPGAQGDNLPLCNMGPYLNLSWYLLFDVPHWCKLHGWVLIGDLSSCHVGIGFVFQGEHYVTALNLNTHNATKGLECACQSVRPAFLSCSACHPSLEIHSGRENMAEKGLQLTQVTVTLCRWCPEFPCVLFKVRKIQDPSLCSQEESCTSSVTVCDSSTVYVVFMFLVCSTNTKTLARFKKMYCCYWVIYS